MDASTADIRADLYSLGCTLYFLLAGRPPFHGGTAVQTIMAHLEKDVPPLTAVRSDVPAKLWAVLARVLAKDPAKRYEKPVEFAQALAPFCKPGSKQPAAAPKPTSLPVSSPQAGTKIPGDTSQLPGRRAAAPLVASVVPPPVVPAAAPPADKPVPLVTPSSKPGPGPFADRRKLVIGAALCVGVLVLAVGGWLVSGWIFRVRTADAILVVDVNQSGAEVFVDGDQVEVIWAAGGKIATIRVQPGTHKLSVKKNGFAVYGEEVTLDEGGRRTMTARLERIPTNVAGSVNGVAPRAGDVITNSIGMKMAWIPPGTFLMGSPNNENGRLEHEHQHEVEITRGFYLAVYPVTQMEYEKVMKVQPSYFCAGGKGSSKVAGLDTSAFPVEQVSWGNAVDFCRRLGATEGKSYDLPTEAQWEYACRGSAPQPQAYHFGNSFTSQQANFGHTLGRTSKVGTYPANAFGLFDMHGNVWQHCKDCYDEKYYNTSPKLDPCCMNGSNRVCRGGGWDHEPRYCRSAHRGWNHPAYPRGSDLGFRLALAPSSSE
jgi:formylglycine-generating enzyme required for sulfatase activity